MKKIKLLSYVLVAPLLIFTSCNEDDNTDYGTMRAANTQLSLDIPFGNAVSLEEDDVTYTYTVNLSTPQMVDVRMPVTLVGGTATEGDDFDFDHEVQITKGSTTATGTIEIHKDALPEGDETFTLRLADGAIENAASTSQDVTFTLTNYTEDNLEIVFAWDNGDVYVDAFGGAFPVCPNTDLDVYIANGAGFDINNAWANLINGAWDAATGACPEEWTITPGDFADGEYVFFTDLYDNAFAGFGSTDSFAVTATFTKVGVFTESVVQDDTQAFNADTPAGAFNGYVAKLTIAGSTYTIEDYAGNEVVTGRVNPNRPAQVAARKTSSISSGLTK